MEGAGALGLKKRKKKPKQDVVQKKVKLAESGMKKKLRKVGIDQTEGEKLKKKKKEKMIAGYPRVDSAQEPSHQVKQKRKNGAKAPAAESLVALESVEAPMINGKKRKVEAADAVEARATEVEVRGSKENGKPEALQGMRKWLAAYDAKRPGLAVLQQQIDSFIADYEEREEQANKERQTAAAKDDGWTLVSQKKGRKKTTDAASGIAVGAVSEAAVAENAAKKKPQTASDFYKFQKRDARRNEVLELQLKFQEDKKKIAQMRAARKFRPY